MSATLAISTVYGLLKEKSVASLLVVCFIAYAYLSTNFADISERLSAIEKKTDSVWTKEQQTLWIYRANESLSEAGIDAKLPHLKWQQKQAKESSRKSGLQRPSSTKSSPASGSRFYGKPDPSLSLQSHR